MQTLSHQREDMGRHLRRLLVALLIGATTLAGCAEATPARVAADAPTAVPPTAAPPLATAPPDLRPTPPPEPTLAPTPLPPTTAPLPPTATPLPPTATPLPPTAAPSATATPAAPALAPLDVSAQAAALLPDFVADLDRAEAWDRYTIAATLDPAALTVRGTQLVEVRNRADTPFDALYFHLYPNHPDFGGGLRVENVRVDGQPAPVSTEQNNVLLRIDLPRPLAPGEWAQVTMEFVARTQRNASRSAYGAFNQQSGVWALANFYPVLAVYRSAAAGADFVGWDRRPVSSRGDLAVTETALYAVTLDAPAGWTLATTGVRVDAAEAGAGLRRERFVSGPQRDFFLAALQGLDQASAVVDGTRIVAYYQPGNAGAGQRSLTVAEQSLRIFNQRYGRYPLAELDVVQAALTRFLGVEYPGIVLIEENLYARNGRGLETTVAHEVAHQWWYSLVGNDYQGEPWIDEGLASFSQIVYYEGIGDGGQAAAELQSFRDFYLATRNAGRDQAVDQPVTAFSGNYVALVYAKSALFFQALRDLLGDDVFFAFLQNYYATHRYGDATGADLLAAAEATCGCDLQQLYADWITDAAAVPLP